MSDGGYDEGYRKCPCFWGREPSSLVLKLQSFLPNLQDLTVLDAGCGEGKNAAYFANNGAIVRALDISEIAIVRARESWDPIENVKWEVADVRQLLLLPSSFDIVIAYGLLHCFSSTADIRNTVEKLKDATKESGFNIICTFNDRHQELDAHPGFHPCLLPHSLFIDLYSDWNILVESDSDLREQHPHNNIEHTHSMTRIIAQRKESR